jgi:hypothetical protein
LVGLTTALADEEREGMLARRAADRVKRDLDREPDKLVLPQVGGRSQAGQRRVECQPQSPS